MTGKTNPVESFVVYICAPALSSIYSAGGRCQRLSGNHNGKRKILLLLLVFCTWLFISPAQAKYSGGSGTPQDPYLIGTPEDLNDIGNHEEDWDKYFILVNDIDLAQYTGTEFKMIGTEGYGFTGVFDGKGHKVLNFTWSSSNLKLNGVGLFRHLWPNGLVKNLGMENVNVNAGNDGSNVGGLVGANSATISACYSTGIVSGGSAVGGLAGSNGNSTIINSYSAASVSGTTSVGGLLGSNWGTVINCYSTGNVEGSDEVGGLAGSGPGSVNSFWDIETSGCNTSAGGRGKKTAEMKIASTYFGWGGPDSAGIWTIEDGKDYPRLAWEGRPGQPFPKQQLSDFVAGGGTEADPYLISTPEGLNAIGLFPCEWLKHFRLMADIDMSAYTGLEFNQIGVGYSWMFNGVFDGNGHTISNFTYHSNVEFAGLFGYIGYQGVVRNLGLINVDVSGISWVGGLAASISGPHGGVSNCYVTGRVSGQQLVGGLIGRGNGMISNCYSTARVSGNQTVGGLMGANEGLIYNCYAAAKVTGNTGVAGIGLVGGPAAVVASFWDIETTGQAVRGGGNGKTTAEMKMARTYFGWGGCGNEGVWTIDEGNDYPHLAWEGKPGQPIPRQQLSDLVPGSGTETDPYLISTAEQLNSIGLFPCEWDKHFRLMADIDISAYKGVEFNRIGAAYWWPFTGVFDGNRYTIFKFTSYAIEEWGAPEFVGLFSTISSPAVVKDLGLINVNVAGYQSVGGLVGANFGGTVSGCYATGTVKADFRAGGLIGWNEGKVTTSWARANVSYGHMLGGLVGYNSGTLSDCFARGTTKGIYDFSGIAGLVGKNEGEIHNCYASGPVSGGKTFVGGLVGMDSTGTVAASFWDTKATGRTTSGGGQGKTTWEMKAKETFTDAGWDFVQETINGTEDIWDIWEPIDYPRFAWEPNCMPEQHKDYLEWVSLGKPPCWCTPPTGSGFQCDGDADGYIETVFDYRVYGKDLDLIVANWKKKIGDRYFNPCADIDHKAETVFKYRVYGKDLAIIVANWKKNDWDLPGNCPRNE